MSPDRVIAALRSGDNGRIHERFAALEPIYAAYLSACTMDKLQGEERIAFMQILGQ